MVQAPEEFWVTTQFWSSYEVAAATVSPPLLSESRYLPVATFLIL
jgi:hypothetical protein